jgi:hypothetical protein
MIDGIGSARKRKARSVPERWRAVRGPGNQRTGAVAAATKKGGASAAFPGLRNDVGY